MSSVPCTKSAELERLVRDCAEVLSTQAHTLGTHGLTESEFYNGVFRGAIERLRGQFSATLWQKRDFVRRVLNHMQDLQYIKEWQSAEDDNRHDYTVEMRSGKRAVIEVKGCLDGNNTTIFERPTHAQEFIVWSLCTNPAADPRRNVWSGIHTRLSAEIIENSKQVDGLVVWDWLCGSICRRCPKLGDSARTLIEIGQYRLPPPCLYLLPVTLPSVRNNPSPEPHSLQEVEFLNALHRCFGGQEDEINSVRITVAHRGAEVVRTTSIERAGKVQRVSKPTPIRRA